MVRLVNVINRNKARFHKPPIGPIGHYLSLTDARSAPAASAACLVARQKGMSPHLPFYAAHQLLRALRNCGLGVTSPLWSTMHPIPEPPLWSTMHPIPEPSPKCLAGGARRWSLLSGCSSPTSS
jgi:hypothetical protein